MTLHGATFNGQLTLSSPINISLGVSNGTLTISGAPANVGGSFTSYKPPEQALEVSNTVGFISWSEIFGLRAEGVTVNFTLLLARRLLLYFKLLLLILLLLNGNAECLSLSPAQG